VHELADVALVTSDNPRSEDPAEIAAQVADSLPLEIELDRRRAIERALEAAHEGDVVVIAGKGHEQGQSFDGRTDPFDDRATVAEELRALREDR
jgi:UDP-N-acetylmuramoyl-L-alanyl-D-glutamate--2,6-diaminopimelate ligase